MTRQEMSVTGALVGALGGFITEVAVQELTGHQITHGVLELAGALAGLLRLDKRLAQALRDTLEKAKTKEDEDYRLVKRRIAELTEDLPELREILQNLIEAGIQARRA